MKRTTLKCEYVWLDGGETQELRSKTRVLTVNSEDENWTLTLKDIPLWSFDGSSTSQSDADDSDLVLRPVFACLDSNRENGVIALCDVLNQDMTPHKTNHRASLVDEAIKFASAEAMIGFEQEYFMTKGENLLGHDRDALREQGPYYCAVGTENVVGRNLAELHLNACINSGLSIVGVNAEVALGQWEYQIGGPGVSVVQACDHLWVSRFILHRICELQNVGITFRPKPDSCWNGSGMHSNFSTKTMREVGGITTINKACSAMSTEEAIIAAKESYGEDLRVRLTGKHETCSIDEFKCGVGDRTASIRIPSHVKQVGAGYFEDRRPNANANPYRVARTLIKFVCPVEG